jgi:ATP-dependent RNA helicase DeaD
LVDAPESIRPSTSETRQPPVSPAHDHPVAPAGPSHPGRDEVFERGLKFADLGLRDSVLKGITEAGFEFPTAIQARIIPVILSGKDVLGQAKTGTGKTAAFGLPLLHRIEKGVPFQALVLVPTRELAIQVATDLKELGRFTPLHILPVYGGQNVKTQAQLLSKGPEIIVATPGRVMDMVQRGYINYRSIKFVVLDEVDRMLDIGFRDDIRRILSGCPRERQTIFVSATIHSEIEALARSFCNQCEKIIASAGSLTVSMVKQWHLPVQPWDKKQLLLHLLTHEDPALTVVFCRTKKTVDNLAEYLQRKGVDCHAIHGDMYQNKRNKVMEQLRAGKLEVLIASDVASRGLDVEGITHVINYDLPEDPDLYVHRIGRTARAGREGVAWSLVTPEQGGLLTEIELLINAEIPKLDYPDFKPGPVPSDVLHRQQSDQRRVDNARQFNRFSSVPAPGGGGGGGGGSPSSGAQAASGAPGTSSAAPARMAAPAPQADPNRFPGGIVPTMAPPKRMFGRVKTARSMKAAIQQSFTPQANPQSPPAAAPTPPEE